LEGWKVGKGRQVDRSEKWYYPNMSQKLNTKLKPEIRVALERTKNIPEEEIEREFDEALQDARTTAKKTNITQEDIDAEIRAVRAEKVHTRKPKKK
jgi:hypothetical protein